MIRELTHFFLTLLILSIVIPAFAQQDFTPNYDESKIPAYTLPDALTCVDGAKVADKETWVNKRRPELMTLFAEHVYGRTPEGDFPLHFEAELDENTLGGKAVRKQVSLYPFGKDKNVIFDLLIYLPKNAPKPVPAFIGLNFGGNQTIHPDPGIRIMDHTRAVMKSMPRGGDVDPETRRGESWDDWQVEKIIDRGYAIATIYYGDIDPDFDDEFKNGIQPYFYKDGQEKPEPDEWGSIGAWSWGLSRALDYFEKDADIDANHVALMGHSRLGKTALWAGASDERFAIVISNNSGCGGAALSRRAFGETVGRINRAFPHWFCDNYTKYNENEGACPVDQHELLALIAPRPLYVASAEEDRWADPRGEFLSALHAQPVYELFGLEGLGVTEMPDVNHPVGNAIGYHIRTGRHAVTEYDWEQYLDFADRHFKK